jgi:hypothetical protein
MAKNTAAGEKREINAGKKPGITVTDILIAAVLIAAGAVLKVALNAVFAGFFLKPNTVIAMYALAIMLIRPKFLEALAIGVIAGVVCMFLPGATPYANLASETAGAVVLALLMKIPFDLKIRKISFRPSILTFFTTLASGYTFFLALRVMIFAGMNFNALALGAFNVIIIGTAAANAIIVFVLYPALSIVVKKK